MTKQYGTPGPRAIYPEMCSSPSLGRCGILANALFPRLIAQADDQGRLAGDATTLTISCMPRLLRVVTIDAVAEAIAELAAVSMILTYQVRDEAYVQLLQWWRWQSSQRRAYPSRWPAPPGWHDIVYGIGRDSPETYDIAVVTSPRRNAAIRGTLQRPAASRVGADAGADAGARARAMPDRALASTVPSREPPPAGANGAAGGLRASAQAIIDDPNASEDAKAGARAMLELGGRM